MKVSIPGGKVGYITESIELYKKAKTLDVYDNDKFKGIPKTFPAWAVEVMKEGRRK